MAALVLAPKLLVLIREDGIQLQRHFLADPLILDSAGLLFLSLLDTGNVEDSTPVLFEAARQAGVDPTSLNDLHLALRVSNDLEVREPWEHPEAPDHPDLASLPPFDLGSEELVTLKMPLTLRLRRGKFEVLDADGFRWLALDPAEAAFVGRLCRPTSVVDALAAVDSALHLGRDEAAMIVARLGGAGLLRRGPAVLSDAADLDEDSDEALALRRDEILAERFRANFERQNTAEEARRAQTGEVRPRVIPVAFDLGIPAGLAMVTAYARTWEEGRLDEEYELRTDWWWNEENFDFLTAEPAIYLFSNYLWSHALCLEVSRRVKERSPGSITVHGGPDTPKYERDVERYFAANPHVDVTVRGEGEVTTAELLAALRPVIGSAEPDLTVLADVAGLSFRTPEGPVSTADRERIADLDTIPSPYLMGLVDVYRDVPDVLVTLETNRGCPYGCTFCDWGSATTSRVRKYDIDRVFGELQWCSDMRITSVSVADANFGMFARDVDIAAELARVRSTSDFPRAFGVSYAKNTVKHLEQIIGMLTDAGVMSQGVLSLQSMDADTLQVVHRSNIKTERYDALAARMRSAKLPLMVELMMGLPGMTVESFADDLQQCIEREVPARINRTTLLVNSPMNDPAYMAEHKIETHEPLQPGRNALVVSTATFTREDWNEMERFRVDFGYFENYGVLRLVSRYVRHRTGVREIDLIRQIGLQVAADPARWPTLAATVTHGSEVMAPIHSWALMMAEVKDYLGEAFGLSGSGLDAVLVAQRAVLPASGRVFPAHYDLQHDVVGWYQAMLHAKTDGSEEHWTELVPQLDDLPPATLTVDDPSNCTDRYIGMDRESYTVGVSWELDSPLSRAHLDVAQLPDWITGRRRSGVW
ncbi:MAG TPA: radical SAM protein [Acidimicrobiales bacterium]|nr:radical SAM protein [Acidimicrobiales bacterium]